MRPVRCVAILANIEEVRVKGLEADATFLVTQHFTGYVSSAITNGKYVSYTNGPCPLELIGSTTTVCDLSGKPLSGTPHTVVSAGGEYHLPMHVERFAGETFLRADLTSRTDTYGDPSDSKYTVIKGYTVVNASMGLRAGVALGSLRLGEKPVLQELHAEPDGPGRQFRSDRGHTERSAHRRCNGARLLLGHGPPEKIPPAVGRAAPIRAGSDFRTEAAGALILISA